jgi:trehalose utilization protein
MNRGYMFTSFKQSLRRTQCVLPLAVGMAVVLGAWQESKAQMDKPFNGETEYQRNPHSKVKRVLLYNRTFGGHDKAPLLNAMRRLQAKYGFQLDVSGADNYITTATLEGVDVAIFSNGDGDVLSNATSLAAVRNFVEVKGKGLLQTHAAAAYIPCPTSGEENLADANCKWLARVLVRQYFHHNGDNSPARIYADSVLAGAVPPRAVSGTPAATINHGRKNPETINIFKGLPKNGMGANPAQEFVWDASGDEWYNYRGNPRLQGAQTFNGVAFGPINILMSLDESSYTPAAPTMGDHPMAWARKVGNGLTVYMNAGHSDNYTRPRGTVRDSIIEKIDWNMIRYLARDYVGCMDATKGPYNPDASVAVLTPGLDPADPCVGTSAVSHLKGKVPAGISISEAGVVIPTIEREAYRIVASNAKGERVFSASLTGGPGQNITALENKKGTYYIEVSTPKMGKTVSKVTLP